MRVRQNEPPKRSIGLWIIVVLLFSLGLGLAWFLDAGSTHSDSSAGEANDPIVELDLQPELVVAVVQDDDALQSRTVADKAGAPPALPEPDQLWGIVVRASDGQPIPDAEIRLVHRDADEFWNLDLEYGKREQLLAEARSNAEGRFEFTVTRGHSHRLKVEAGGYAGRTLTSCFGGDEVRIELDQGASISGLIREEGSGRPISDATIRVGVRGESNPLGVTRSLQDGSFHLSALPRAEVFVQARPRDYAEVWQRVDLVPGETHRVTFDMPIGQVIHGRVTEAARGYGISGVELSDSWTFKRYVATDRDGSYELRGVKAQSDIHLRVKGFARQIKQVNEAVEGRLDFVLSQGGGVRGRVLDAKGKPLSSVYVAVASSFMTRPGMESTDWLPVEVGADGRFLRRGMNPVRPYSIYLRGRGIGSRIYAFPRAVADGEVLDIGDLVMKPAGRIEGRVIEGSGNPLASARVTLRGYNIDHHVLVPAGERGSIAEREVSQFQSRDAISTATGVFSFADVSGGSYGISVQPNGRSFREKFGPFELSDGDLLEGLDLTVQFGLSISGRIEMGDGTELSSSTYSLLRLYREGAKMESALVRADGTFRFEQLEEGSYSISAMQLPKGLSLPVRTDVRAGVEDLRLFLQPAAKISGRVVDADGKPMADVQVSYGYGKDSYLFEGMRIVVPTLSEQTDAEGRFEFEVPPGVRGLLSASGGISVDEKGQILIKRAQREDVPAGSHDLLLTMK